MARILSQIGWAIVIVMSLSPYFVEAEKSNFFYTMLPNENMCFEELFSLKIGVHAIVKWESKMVSMRVYDTQARQMFYKEREGIMDFSFTSDANGGYKFWVMNYARGYTKIEVNIMSGVDAKNYDTLVTTKKLKPVELQAQKIEDMSREVKQLMSAVLESEEFMKIQESKTESFTYEIGIVSIVVMALITGVTSFILRTYFNKKKKM